MLPYEILMAIFISFISCTKSATTTSSAAATTAAAAATTDTGVATTDIGAATTDTGAATTDTGAAVTGTTDTGATGTDTTDSQTTDSYDDVVWDYSDLDGSFALSDADDIEFYDDTFDFSAMICSFDLDDDYSLLDTSYITTQYSAALETKTFLIASDIYIGSLPEECAQFPALKIIDREVDGSYITLYVQEADFFEYLNALDVDMSDVPLSQIADQLFENPAEGQDVYEEFEVESADTYNTDCEDISNFCESGYDSAFSFGEIPTNSSRRRRRRAISESVSISIGATPSKQAVMKASIAGASVDFRLSSGIDFSSTLSVNFKAKFKVNSFNSFQVTVKAATSFEAYMNLKISGALNFKLRIINIKKRFTFFVGFIPISLVIYSDLYTGYKSTEVPLSVSFAAGYDEISYEFGYKYAKADGWTQIQEFSGVEFYQKYSGNIDESDTCFWVEITPFIEFRMGVVFYDFVNVFLENIITATTDLMLPGTCDDTASCDHDDLQLMFDPTFALEVYVGMELLQSPFFDDYIPDPIVIYSTQKADISPMCVDFTLYLYGQEEECCNLEKETPDVTNYLDDEDDDKAIYSTVSYSVVLCLFTFVYM